MLQLTLGETRTRRCLAAFYYDPSAWESPTRAQSAFTMHRTLTVKTSSLVGFTGNAASQPPRRRKLVRCLAAVSASFKPETRVPSRSGGERESFARQSPMLG